MADITDPRGKLLLGEAVRLLVQAGATGVAITDFIQDYSAVIEATLAAPRLPPESDLKQQIKAALIEALQELAPPSRRTVAGMRKQVVVYIAGAKTSLSLRKDLLEKVEAFAGGKKPARQLITQLAHAKPADRANRSAWVEEQLQHRLLLEKVEEQVTRH